MFAFKLAALVELVLVILETSGHAYLKRKLPLGGGHRFRTCSTSLSTGSMRAGCRRAQQARMGQAGS